MQSRILPFRADHLLDLLSIVFGMHFDYLFVFNVAAAIACGISPGSRDLIFGSPGPSKLLAQ